MRRRGRSTMPAAWIAVTTAPSPAIHRSESWAWGSAGRPPTRSATRNSAISTALPPKMSENASWWSPMRTDCSPVLSSGRAVAAARTVAPKTAPDRPIRPASSEPDSSTSTPAIAVTSAAAANTAAAGPADARPIACGGAPPRLSSRPRPGCDSGASAVHGSPRCARRTSSSPPTHTATIATVPGLTPATFALAGRCEVMMPSTTHEMTSTASSTSTREPARKLSGRSWRTARSSTARTTVWIAMPPTRLPTARPTWPLAAAVIVMTSSGRSVANDRRISPPSAEPSPRRVSSASVEFDSWMPATQIAAADATKISASQSEARSDMTRPVPGGRRRAPPVVSVRSPPARVGGVAGDPRARPARLVAPDLVRAVGSEEVAAARRVAEAHGVRPAGADELDRRGAHAREQLVDRTRPPCGDAAVLAGAATELPDDRHAARPRVHARDGPRRERGAVDGRMQDGAHVVADGADLLEARLRGARAHAGHLRRLGDGPAREVGARAQVVVVDHAAAADRVREVHRERLGEPGPERQLHRPTDHSASPNGIQP